MPQRQSSSSHFPTCNQGILEHEKSDIIVSKQIKTYIGVEICHCIAVIYLFIVFLGLQPVSSGTQQSIDSLLSLAASRSIDTIKVLHLIRAAELLQYNNPSHADSISQLALSLSEQLNFRKGINYSLSNLVSLQITRGNYAEAETYNRQLMDLAVGTDNLEAQIKALNRASVIQYYTAEYQKGIETNIEILELLNNQPRHDSRLYALNNIGINYERLNEPQKALQYYHEALEMAVDLEEAYAEAAIAGNVGIIYKNLNQLDTAKHLFLQGIEAARQINNINLLIDETANLAEVFLLQNVLDSAEMYLQRSLDLAREINDQNGVLKAHNLRGRMYSQKGQYRQAVDALLLSATLSDSVGDREMLMNTYHHLQENYRNLGNADAAYRFLRLYSNLRDSIFDLDKNQQLNELEAKFQTAQKSAEIARQQIEIQKKNNQRNQLIGMVVYLILHRATIIMDLNYR
ncbi:MAG: tetratricopeptide repeat protein, partial [Saprospiraceae bacterium]|nr:tetratricopeptide repeat protein [Saprospiraceae bacterium]